jgi:hypothetical protein
MRKIALTIAAGVLGLSLAGSADAAPAHRGPAHAPRHAPARVYHQSHGVRFSGGYYYRGYNHHHWSRRVWDPVHCRYQYWDPYYNCYYFWYAPANCYYPITFCP